jgi:quercetin dioxygenase-like cupin family protein
VRRIVTGHDASGKSVVLSDAPPPVVREIPEDGVAFYEIWSTDESPAPVAPDEPDPTEGQVRVPPSPRGTKIRINEMQPGARSPMHRTESVDYGIVLEGEIYLVLDDSEVRIGPGDVVVQRGTDHAWENRSDSVARVVFVLVGGEFTDELRDLLPPDVRARLMDTPNGA